MSESNFIRDYLPIIILIIITIGFSLFLNVGLRFLLNTSTPQVAVTTGSMMPTYNGYLDSEVSGPYQEFLGLQIPTHMFRGDILIIKNVPSVELSIGDVIVFNANKEQPIVHRIVQKREQVNNPGHFEYLTKGDNNSITDLDGFDWITEDNVLGKVILRIPKLGWLSLQLQSLTGRIAIIFIALFLLVSSFLEEETHENNTSIKKTKKHSKRSDVEKEPIITSELIKRITNNTFLGKRSSTFIVTLGLILIILVFNIGLAVSGNCSVEVFSRSADTFPTILDCKRRYDVENITSSATSAGFNDYVANVRYAIRSAGLFNHIKKIEVSTNTSISSYFWTIVYSFNGKKVVNGIIPLRIPKNISNCQIDVQITMFTKGILSNGKIINYYTVQVKQF